MKKILTILVCLTLCIGIATAAPTNSSSSGNISFKAGFNSKKPMLVFIYAPWSDNSEQLTQNINSLKRVYGNSVNIVPLDISQAQAKDYNDMLPIQPKLPHMMMFKDKAKISRYIPKECVIDYACLSKRVNAFVR